MAKRKPTKKKKSPVKRRGAVSSKSLEKDFLNFLETEIEEEEIAREFNEAFEAEIEKELFKPAAKHLKAAPIQYDKVGMRKLRNMVRKKDGTFFSKRYYENLLKKIGGKKQDDFDDALIALRNKNPNVRYYIESKGLVLYFQVGNFVDRLAGRKQTVELGKGKHKRKGKAVVTGEMKKGTSISITTFLGDETEFTSIIHANDVIRTQTSIIDKCIAILSPQQKEEKNAKKVKRKGTGVYVLIEEIVTSNSEKEVVKISYNYAKYEIQGIPKQTFADVLDEVLHS